MNISEDTFGAWAKGPAQTESEKCDNAETAIRKALAADRALSQLNTTVFAQGSYKARTNIRQDSDVDICIRYNGSFFYDVPTGKTKEDFGITDGTLPFSDFKAMVEKALKSYFGERSVVRGKKAFDIHETTYRVDSDVIPTFDYHYYTGRFNADNTHHVLSGVAFFPDGGTRIVNWPQQTYDNGVKRHDETGRHYKRVIRIFKRLRNKMQDEGIAGAKNVASFLIECLVWNAPVAALKHEKYSDDVRQVIYEVWNATQKDETCSTWGEVNELKYLFRTWQPWTREQANQFMHAAWNYIGFK